MLQPGVSASAQHCVSAYTQPGVPAYTQHWCFNIYSALVFQLMLQWCFSISYSGVSASKNLTENKFLNRK
jgi:hypothetical protein